MTDASMHDLTIEVLKGIRSDLAGLREEVAGLRRETNEGLAALRSETHQGFEVLGHRIDNVLLGEHGREHARLREVEGRLAACERGIEELRSQGEGR